MREIKFRAVQNGKILGYVSTDPIFNGGSWFQVDYSVPEEDRIMDCCLGSLFPDFKNACPLSGVEFEQYAGLKDKNGVEIYEGDIIRDGKGGDGVVQYVPNISSFMMWADGQYWHLNEGDTERACRLVYTEIIGNIHESQELMG